MTTNKDFWDNTLEHCSKEDKDYIASILCPQLKWERDYEQEQTLNTVLDKISAEIKDLHNSHMINFVSADGAVDTCLEIIEKHKGGRGISK